MKRFLDIALLVSSCAVISCSPLGSERPAPSTTDVPSSDDSDDTPGVSPSPSDDTESDESSDQTGPDQVSDPTADESDATIPDPGPDDSDSMSGPDTTGDTTDPSPVSPGLPSDEPVRLEAEDVEVGGEYADTVTDPFPGVGLYANDDYVRFEYTYPTIPGSYRLNITGASSSADTATAELLRESAPLEILEFSGTTSSTASVDLEVAQGDPPTQQFTIRVVNDDGSWDLFIDHVEFELVGGPTTPTPNPVTPTPVNPNPVTPGAPGLSDIPVWESRQYRNLFVELGKTEAEVDARVNEVVDVLFHGSENQRIYYERGNDEAYIYTADTDDVRSEGVSYGMMIAVQLDKKTEFDRLWKFAKTHMQHQSGGLTGYFAWQVRTNGSHIDPNPAPDGEEYFAMSLFMAAKRWGNGTGIYNYEGEANYILDHMLNQSSLTGTRSLIDPNRNQIIFSPQGEQFTDPSYHLPHFYELWGRWAQKDNERWFDIAYESRQLFKRACHPVTGLAPDYCTFDGSPTGGDHMAFRFDAWRVAMNIALDSVWWNTDPWARDTWVKNYLRFFHDQGVSTHLNQFNIDGSGAMGDHSPGLVAMNAVAALISDEDIAWDFVQEFWDTPPNLGQYRYYDGCLYLFGLLAVTGRYQIIGE